MGPMGLQCDKLQREDLDHYKQPLQQRRRGHGKTYNVSKKRGHTSTLEFFIPIAEHAKVRCIAGSVADGHTMHVTGI